MARGFAAAASIAALAVLAGCSVIGGGSAACPTVSTADGAGQLVRFKGGGADLTDIAFQAHIGSLAAECRFDGDERVGSVDLDILFRTQRGPASSAAEHGFGYFVAVVDPEGGAAARTPFTVEVSFEGSRTEAARQERLALDIPVAENTALAAYRVYVGLQLTKAQFERNLANRR